MRKIKAALAAVVAWLDDDGFIVGAFAFCLGFAITWGLMR